jgi:hypothetical protein
VAARVVLRFERFNRREQLKLVAYVELRVIIDHGGTINVVRRSASTVARSGAVRRTEASQTARVLVAVNTPGGLTATGWLYTEKRATASLPRDGLGGTCSPGLLLGPPTCSPLRSGRRV